MAIGVEDDPTSGLRALTDARRSPMLSIFKELLRDDEGATAVEYGMIVAGIAAVIVTIVFALGVKLNTPFTTVSDKLP
jgi:pilus assembly protein Flp/PilA